MSDFKAVKFAVGVPVEVTLEFDQPRKTPSGKYPGKTIIWYGIKELISGENGFNASEKLCELIDLQKYAKGDSLQIEKCQSESKDGKSYQFFKVNGQSLYDLNTQFNAPQAAPPVKAPPVTPQSVGTIMTNEQKMKILWSDYESRNGIVQEPAAPVASQPQPLVDDEDIPF